ncbi:MAG: cation transporter [Hydrotalea sp.]|nr:cation transporter [Hydrotalea sp.]
MKKELRRIILVIAALNLLYFAVEFFYAVKINSVALTADSIDFLEDAAMNLLVFFAALWSALWRRRVGLFLAITMALPAVATIWALYRQLTIQIPPSGHVISWVSLGALAVNVFCSLLLVGHQRKNKKNNLLRATYLSSRNDAINNIAIIATGLITIFYPSIWPDVVVGVFIAILHSSGALEVYQKSLKIN